MQFAQPCPQVGLALPCSYPESRTEVIITTDENISSGSEMPHSSPSPPPPPSNNRIKCPSLWNFGVRTGWGGHLFRRFCLLFSECFSESTAAAMLPKQARRTYRKHITKPSKQVAVPPSVVATEPPTPPPPSKRRRRRVNSERGILRNTSFFHSLLARSPHRLV